MEPESLSGSALGARGTDSTGQTVPAVLELRVYRVSQEADLCLAHITIMILLVMSVTVVKYTTAFTSSGTWLRGLLPVGSPAWSCARAGAAFWEQGSNLGTHCCGILVLPTYVLAPFLFRFNGILCFYCARISCFKKKFNRYLRTIHFFCILLPIFTLKQM